MIRGIGIDSVQISTIQQYITAGGLSGAFIRHTFTEAEQQAAIKKRLLPNTMQLASPSKKPFSKP